MNAPQPLKVQIWREGAFVRSEEAPFTEYVETADGVIARYELPTEIDAWDEVRIDVMPPKTGIVIRRATFIEAEGLLQWNVLRTNASDESAS